VEKTGKDTAAKLSATTIANQHAMLMGRRGLGQRTLARITEASSEDNEGQSGERKSK
jgi:Holliday junction resolvasome RuvABC ATP-dependent DNA helicase subunit